MQKIPLKHKGLYREKDALRKRKHRQKMKANPIAYKERLRVQEEKNKEYRQRVKESIATATVRILLFRKST